MEEGDKPQRRRSRREERKEETRAELIETAAKVFARRGFVGASLDEIAREAGYSTGAIYWHFAGKDHLFMAVYEEQAAARVRDVETFRDRGGEEIPPRAYADQFMSRFRDEPEFLVLSLEFLVHAWRNPRRRESFAHRIAWGRLATARLLEEEAERGGYELPMPPEDLATVLRELGTGLALAKLADPEEVSDRLFGDFVELFFELLRERRASPVGNAHAEAGP